MPIESLLGQLFNLGFPAVIAVLIFFAYRDQTKALLEALQNNTKAMEKLEAMTSRTVDNLTAHDVRAIEIGDCVDQITQAINRVDVRTIRIEEKLDWHDKSLQAWAVLPKSARDETVT